MDEALAQDTDGSPIWESVVVVMPRKNGKTSLLAAYALYRLWLAEGYPEILFAASSDEQAGRLFDAAAMFVRQNPELREEFRVRDFAGEIVREDGQGRIKRLSSDPKRLFGYNPSLVVCDELGEWTTPTLKRVYTALTTGGGARQAPQVFSITTAGDAMLRHTSILGRILDGAEAAGEVEDEPGLTIMRHHAARMLVFNYEAPTEDPHDVKAMKLANPAPWITEEFLRRQAENPELSDADVLQYHGCVWAESEDLWIPRDAWAVRAAPLQPLEWIREQLQKLPWYDGPFGRPPTGTKVVLGFDGSYNRDSTALIGCTLDGYLWIEGLWERPERAPDDWRIPRDKVDTAVAKAMERYDVEELACDPPGWTPEIELWEERYGDVVARFETNQRARMSPACDRFHTAVFEGGLTHSGDPRLARHIANTVERETPSGTVIAKPDDPKRKIDASVASVVAFERAIVGSNEPEPFLEVI